MSSGFISGGTIDAPIERDDEWLAAQKEIEDLRRKRAEESKQNDGRSLFEILEANKASKQEAFEEANKLKNQFRSLDEDEIEFLDSVMESTRREEERVKRETKEGLEAFRKQQELVDKNQNVDPGSGEAVEEKWVAGPRKRKRAKEKEGLKGVKLRKSSTSEQPATSIAVDSSPNPNDRPMANKNQPSPSKSPALNKPTSQSKASPSIQSESIKVKPKIEQKPLASIQPASGPRSGGLALVGYGSDDDDD